MHSEERRIYFALLTAGIIVVALIVFFIITILRYQRRKVSAQLLTLQQEMQIQETERSRIASDLHDDLNSGLSVIKLRLSFLSAADAEQQKLIEETSHYVDELSDKVRHLSNQLLPMVLERQGLQKALEELIFPLDLLPLFSVDYDWQLRSSLLPEASIHLYRMFQEIINNILKHSQARRVLFKLWESRETIFIHTADNGKGFDLSSEQDKKGMGLQNIRMRADILQAKLYITTSPGNGVQYDIEIPKRGITTAK